MGSMDASKPPPMSEKEKLQKKKQKEMMAKIEEKERQAKLKFRTKIESRINEFLKKENERTLKFEAMDKYHRSVVHDVSEVAGLVSYSFGDEEIDRHIQVWKKEFTPCEGELSALRRGEEWDPVKFQQEKEEKEWRDKLEEERSRTLNKVAPKTNYKDKYSHLIGTEAALDAAKKTEANAKYGMVSAELKKDRRTVEDIQAELRAKKRQKIDDNPTE